MTMVTRITRTESKRDEDLGQTIPCIVLGFFLVAHGVAHTLAFSVQWQFSQAKGIAHTTTLLGGRLDVGDVGIRFDGLLWLVAALGFIVAGMRLAWRKRLEPVLLTATTIFSLVLCVLGLPQAWMGVVIDVAILIVVAAILGVRSWEALDREEI